MSTGGTILITDNDAECRAVMASALKKAGYEIIEADDGDVAIDTARGELPRLVILDVNLPSLSGYEVCHELKEDFGDGLPIILVSGERTEPFDRVAGMLIGADDYLVKPFALEELMARVRAVLRRRGAIPQVLEVAGLLVDEEHGCAARAGCELALTSTELRLLAFLMRHRGQALSKDQLLTQVWGYDAYDPNLVEVHISALRRKLEGNGRRLIHTVRGIGYRFSPWVPADPRARGPRHDGPICPRPPSPVGASATPPRRLSELAPTRERESLITDI
jgi:DNA-binding response OmpR family regulator